MAKGELTSLTELDPVELSLVDAGANMKKRFPITKSKEFQMDKQFEEILKSVLETELDEESELSDFIAKAKVSEKGAAALKSALRILSAYKDEMPKDALDKLASAAGYAAPTMKQDKKMEDEMGGYPDPTKQDEVKKYLEKMPEEVRKALGVPEPKPEPAAAPELPPEMQAIMKAQADQVEALQKKNAEIEKSLAAERDKRELAEWTAKAKAELAHVPGKSVDELAVMLKGLHDTDPKIAEEQFAILKQASEVVKSSQLLTMAGTGSAGSGNSGSAWDRIVKMADGFVEKSAGDLTQAQAIVKVMEVKPDLYNEYLNEHPHQVGPAGLV